MSYIGNTPTTQSFISGTDYFNGTGAQTAFTLSRTVASINDIQVTVNNVVQQPNDAYTISGTTLTMTSAPSAGTNNVYVRYLSTTTQAITPSQNTVSWNTLDSNTQQDLGLMYKNKIINGNMVIDQRNAGASVTQSSSSNLFVTDRWSIAGTQNAKFTGQQSSTSPVGFVNSLLLTSSAATSVSASDFFGVITKIEGYNLADLNFGSANAKTITISFWVRSSVTGTYTGTVNNSDASRCFPFSYTISAANTFEYKTINIVGCPDGTWNTTNGVGAQVFFGLGAGSNWKQAAGAWTSTLCLMATGQTDWISTSGATFYLTGVQLEVGTQATAFSTAGGSYGAELALCQRYFQKTNPDNTSLRSGGITGVVYSGTNAGLYYTFPVQMRSSATATRGGTNDDFYIAGISTNVSGTFNSTTVTKEIFWGEIVNLSAGANGYQIVYNGQLSLSAEL
jgi:hypothetical protein